MSTAGDWVRLYVSVAIVFAVFHGLASALGSDRGQSGVIVAIAVIAMVVALDRLVMASPSLAPATFARGAVRGALVAAAVSGAMLVVVPAYAWARETTFTVRGDTMWLLPGLFAQAGIAEETLFRAFLYGQVRRGRPAMRAAALTIPPFVVAHLLLFATFPWPIAMASIALSAVLTFPFARLFDLGGATIWAPAILHFIVQSVPKVVVWPDADALTFPLVWMAAAAVVPLASLAGGRRRPISHARGILG